ncbi:MAG: metal-binding protein, partial [Peptococcaceae bacterium BICA1-8]
LCVGHDSLFIKYSHAPVTVLAVKDRVLAHNPLAALYCAESYYKNKLFPNK